MRLKKFTMTALLILAALLLEGCGVIATPRPPAHPTQAPFTLAPRPTTQETGEPVAIQPTEQRATQPATEAPTTVPATATLAPTFTRTPTPAATEEVAAAPAGDAALGEQLFTSGAEGALACSSCHSAQDPNLILVGPSLAGVASRADERVPGQSAEEYIHTSIVDPNAYIVPAPEGRTFATDGVSAMPQNYDEVLTEDEVNALVAYLMTLE